MQWAGNKTAKLKDESFQFSEMKPERTRLDYIVTYATRLFIYL
jgi:hypothetical protein